MAFRSLRIATLIDWDLAEIGGDSSQSELLAAL
jgi:hypothetical protein